MRSIPSFISERNVVIKKQGKTFGFIHPATYDIAMGGMTAITLSKQDMIKPVFEYICGTCGQEEYSIKRSYQCPVCDTWMKRMEHNIAKFRCTICHRSWSGVVYLDYCQDCGLEVFDELNETDKKILRMNIYSIKNDDLKKNYLRRYRENITRII